MIVKGQHLRAILRLRCPKCGEGKVFRGMFAMNSRCPSCNWLYGRNEPGYFLGAMYFSYALGIILIGVFTGIFAMIFPSWRLWQWVTAAWVVFLPFVPAVYRYSRVLWLHFDNLVDPSDEEER